MKSFETRCPICHMRFRISTWHGDAETYFESGYRASIGGHKLLCPRCAENGKQSRTAFIDAWNSVLRGRTECLGEKRRITTMYLDDESGKYIEG